MAGPGSDGPVGRLCVVSGAIVLEQDPTLVADQHRHRTPYRLVDVFAPSTVLSGAVDWPSPTSGRAFTVATFARSLMHDPVHHLCGDVRRR